MRNRRRPIIGPMKDKSARTLLAAACLLAVSTAVGWAESYALADEARERALAECRLRGGSGCIVRAWGCNSTVAEEALGLDRAARRRIQEDLRSAGFDPGAADGLFGPRTRAAIRGWQSSRGARATGYLDGPEVEALQAGPEVEALRAEPDVEERRRLPRVVGWRRVDEPAREAADEPVGTGPGATCNGQPVGSSCWLQLANQPGCYVWLFDLASRHSVTWTGRCIDGMAHGTGTWTEVMDYDEGVCTGHVERGKASSDMRCSHEQVVTASPRGTGFCGLDLDDPAFILMRNVTNLMRPGEGWWTTCGSGGCQYQGTGFNAVEHDSYMAEATRHAITRGAEHLCTVAATPVTRTGSGRPRRHTITFWVFHDLSPQTAGDYTNTQRDAAARFWVPEDDIPSLTPVGSR